jgi:serine/threonine protein phosphatase PrpC
LVYEGFADFKHLHMLGVMDGHGQYGHLVSQFVKA